MCDTMLGAAGLAARRADQQRREEAEQRERGWQEYHQRAAAERAAARDAAWAEASARAEAAGQCLRCLRRSDFERAPRLVRHRDPANCPEARKQGAW